MLRIATLFFGFVLFATRPGWAGQLVSPPRHNIDVDEVMSLDKGHRDTSAPGKVRILGWTISRGRPPACVTHNGETLCSWTSVDDFGYVRLRVHAPSDNRTKPRKMGYRLAVIKGTLPHGLDWPTYDIAAAEGRISIGWSDGTSLQQEPFSFVLSIRAVDAAGNVGAPRKIRLSHPGRGARGRGPGRR